MNNINIIRLVKIADIIVFSNIYFYLGIFTSYILYKYFCFLQFGILTGPFCKTEFLQLYMLTLNKYLL